MGANEDRREMQQRQPSREPPARPRPKPPAPPPQGEVLVPTYFARPTAGAPRDSGQQEFEYATRCRILRKLADGGMGSVYLSEQVGEAGFAKTVVVKLVKADRLQNAAALSMFVDEAKLVADLVHTNIVQVYNLGEVGGRYFIVMEYLHGKTLSQYIKQFQARSVPPPADMGAFMISRVCRGLAYAHSKRDRDGRHLGIVHRDVTPSNVMLDFRGSVKLTDFGIAKALTMNMPDESKVIMGKFPYMSPEQVAGERTDARSDIYSLGLVLYELLTLTRVYTAATRAELLEMMNKYRIKDPRKIVSTLPDELVEITMKALRRGPEDRFQDAAEFGDALERHMYTKGYGPTNEKLAKHVLEVWPEVDRDCIW